MQKKSRKSDSRIQKSQRLQQRITQKHDPKILFQARTFGTIAQFLTPNSLHLTQVKAGEEREQWKLKLVASLQRCTEKAKL